MITQSAPSSRHLTDAELMRHIDSEGTPPEREQWRHHLAACPACAAEVEALREGSRAVTAWLERAAFEAEAGSEVTADKNVRVGGLSAPRPGSPLRAFRASPAWLRLAAALLLVAGPLAALTPVREWVGERVALLRGGESSPATAATPATPATADAPPAGADAEPPVIRFVPAPGDFTLVIEAEQAGGTLSVSRAGGAEVLFEGGEERAEVIVSPSVLRVRNDAGSSGGYAIALPPTITRLEIAIGAGTTTLEGTALARGVTIPLGRDGG